LFVVGGVELHGRELELPLVAIDAAKSRLRRFSYFSLSIMN